jgi:hypothetical protein
VIRKRGEPSPKLNEKQLIEEATNLSYVKIVVEHAVLALDVAPVG